MLAASRFPFSNKRRLLLGVVLLVAASAALYGAVGSAKYVARLVKGKPDPNKIVRQGLYVNAEDLNLGEVYYADTLEHTFTVHNPTDKPIKIESWSTSCSCSTVEPNQLTVPAMGYANAKGKINLVAAIKKTNSSAVQEFSVLYIPQLNILEKKLPDLTLGWQINGKAIPLLIGSRNVNLGRHSILNQTGKQKRFEWAIPKDVKEISISTNSTHFLSKIISTESQKLVTEISINEALPLGIHDTPMEFNIVTSDTHEAFTVQIIVSVNICDDIEVIPENVTFKRVNEDVLYTSIAVHSLSNMPISVSLEIACTHYYVIDYKLDNYAIIYIFTTDEIYGNTVLLTVSNKLSKPRTIQLILLPEPN